MIKTKIVSSLEKAFFDEDIDKFEALEELSALKGERVSIQLLYSQKRAGYRHILPLTLSGELAEYATAYDVCNVPVTNPVYLDRSDDNYLRKTPGMYPDVLRPINMNSSVVTCPSLLGSVWIQIELPEKIKAGKKSLLISLKDSESAETFEHEFKIEVIDAVLPKDPITNTEWFHCDSLANYYGVKVWSKRHWRIVESFLRTARKNGMNMVLTPIFTPPLDTKIGSERLTNQLIGITVKDGKYSFDFKLLDKWITMCNRVGIKYFEMAHLFTQWGALHAPKIMATVDGEYKRIFGWDTDAHSEEYGRFLRQLLTELIEHMKARGDDKRCYFHISDEPSIDSIEDYARSKAQVAEVLKDYTIMDAMSKYDFLEKGLVDMAIPASNHIEPFLEKKVDNLWTYYCCSQGVGVSNRFIAMPSYRNRTIGMQMYKYKIAGFLQWGYNFYQNAHSVDVINPYLENSGAGAYPAGDPFSVYPAPDGTALESLRLVVFSEALQDLAAMRLLEKYMPHEKIVQEIEKAYGESIEFSSCAKRADQVLSVREKINELIKKFVSTRKD